MSEANAPLDPFVYLLGCPPEVWLMRSKQSPDPADQNWIEWPITEAKLCGVARQHGLLMDRLRNDSGYRLWDLSDGFGNCAGLFPVDLTMEGEYVDTLPGIAIWLWGFSH